MPYSMTIAWSDEDKMFVAICPEFGISVFGPTPADAAAQLTIAIDLAAQTYVEDKQPLPDPILIDQIQARETELERLLKWVRDLQDTGQVNCVYCGWNAGPRESTEPALAEQLYQHVMQCDKHPARALRDEVDELLEENCRLRAIRQAAEKLSSRLRLIAADPAFLSVFQSAKAHGVPYGGPNWVVEMDELSSAMTAERTGG